MLSTWLTAIHVDLSTCWGFIFSNLRLLLPLPSLFILSSHVQSTFKEWGVKLHLSEGGESTKLYGILLQGNFVSLLVFTCFLFMQTFFFFWVSVGTQYLFCTWGYNPVMLYSVAQIVSALVIGKYFGLAPGFCGHTPTLVRCCYRAAEHLLAFWNS